jgi:hypothetical protein
MNPYPSSSGLHATRGRADSLTEYEGEDRFGINYL